MFVSLHHNWWSTRCDQYLPEVNYDGAYVHLYNNYYNITANTTGIAALTNAEILVERNQFTGLTNPLSKSGGGLIYSLGNVLTGTSGTSDVGTDLVFTPSYSYELMPTANVAAKLTAPLAGAGNVAGASSVTPVTASASITGAPSTAVALGGSFTLTAAPSGFTGTAWQWRLNNISLPSANNATYAVTNMQSANVGDYTVVMSGSASGNDVVSTPVTVMLASSSSSSSSSGSSSSSSSSGSSGSSSGGSSGGGGGAPSAWFLAALALLGASRRFVSRGKR
jgi:uncharacterized membrane protein YgcG